jgi:hypothetical protein
MTPFAALTRRQAGILAAPPRMVETVSAWIVGVVATEALRQVAERRDELAVDGKWWRDTITGPFAIGADDAASLRAGMLDELDRVEAEARRLGGRPPSGPAPQDYTQKFPLDLSGWPHAAMVEQRIAERRARDPRSLWMFDQMYDPITVVVYRTLKERRGANIAATWRGGFLTVWGLPPYLHRAREFGPYIDRLRRIIRHELQHLAQDLLREATGVDAAGGHRTRSSPHPDGLHPGDEHALRDVEFHTRLQDAIEGYGGGTDNASIRSHVDAGPVVRGAEPDEFFTTLKRYDRRKWVRAVSEFVRAVGGRASIPPLRQRHAHMSPFASRAASRVASRFLRQAGFRGTWEFLSDESKAVVLGAWMFDLRQGLNGRPGTVYMSGRPKPTKVTVDGDARLKLVGYAVPEVGFVEYDPDRRQVKVLSRSGSVLAYDNVNVRFDITTSALKAAGKALSLAALQLLSDLKRGNAGAAQVREQERADEAERDRERVEEANRDQAGREQAQRQVERDDAWIRSLADFVRGATVRRSRLDEGSPGGPYQTSDTTVERASVDIRPWLQGHGMSEQTFAAALSRVSPRRLNPVGGPMGLDGPYKKTSDESYAIVGGSLVLTYRETFYYN